MEGQHLVVFLFLPFKLQNTIHENFVWCKNSGLTINTVKHRKIKRETETVFYQQYTVKLPKTEKRENLAILYISQLSDLMQTLTAYFSFRTAVAGRRSLYAPNYFAETQ